MSNYTLKERVVNGIDAAKHIIHLLNEELETAPDGDLASWVETVREWEYHCGRLRSLESVLHNIEWDEEDARSAAEEAL